MYAIKGIGQAAGKKITEQIETGRLAVLDEYINKTPSGIFDLLKIKGLGPKKISTIWKELGIESIGELLYACEENRLLHYKGFGAVTQQNIQESIIFYISKPEQLSLQPDRTICRCIYKKIAKALSFKYILNYRGF